MLRIVAIVAALCGCAVDTPATDAGEPCTASSQCEAMCRVDVPEEACQGQSEGTCTTHEEAVGCFCALMDTGASEICID